MLNHPTYQQLNQLRLFGMAQALNEQQRLPELERMSFEERLGLLVEREVSERSSAQTSARLRRAKLKQLLLCRKMWTTGPYADWIEHCSTAC